MRRLSQDGCADVLRNRSPLPISDHSGGPRPLAGQCSAQHDLTSRKRSPEWDVCENTAQALRTSRGDTHSWAALLPGPSGGGDERVGRPEPARSCAAAVPASAVPWLTRTSQYNSAARQKHTILFANLRKNIYRYSFDSFTPDGYSRAGCCHFLFDHLRGKAQCPQITVGCCMS